MDQALMPNGVTPAFVAVNSFLLSTCVAMDGSEDHLDL